MIYVITKKYLDAIYAFLASVFFMSQNVFLSTAANSRTTIAILFFALSIMVLLNERLSVFEKRLLLIIFIFSCIVSHYSTAYIFFVVFLFVFIIIKIIYRPIVLSKGNKLRRIFLRIMRKISWILPHRPLLLGILNPILPWDLIDLFRCDLSLV